MPSEQKPISQQEPTFSEHSHTYNIMCRNGALHPSVLSYMYDVKDEDIPSTPILEGQLPFSLPDTLAYMANNLAPLIQLGSPNDADRLSCIHQQLIKASNQTYTLNDEYIANYAKNIQKLMVQGDAQGKIDKEKKRFQNRMWQQATQLMQLKRECMDVFGILQRIHLEDPKDPKRKVYAGFYDRLNDFFTISVTPLCFALSPPEHPDAFIIRYPSDRIPHYYPSIWKGIAKLYRLSEWASNYMGQEPFTEVNMVLPMHQWWWMVHALLLSPPQHESLTFNYGRFISSIPLCDPSLSIKASSDLSSNYNPFTIYYLQNILVNMTAWVRCMVHAASDISGEYVFETVIRGQLGKTVLELKDAIENTFPSQTSNLFTLEKYHINSLFFDQEHWEQLKHHLLPKEQHKLYMSPKKMLSDILPSESINPSFWSYAATPTVPMLKKPLNNPNMQNIAVIGALLQFLPHSTLRFPNILFLEKNGIVAHARAYLASTTKPDKFSSYLQEQQNMPDEYILFAKIHPMCYQHNEIAEYFINWLSTHPPIMQMVSFMQAALPELFHHESPEANTSQLLFYIEEASPDTTETEAFNPETTIRLDCGAVVNIKDLSVYNYHKVGERYNYQEQTRYKDLSIRSVKLPNHYFIDFKDKKVYIETIIVGQIESPRTRKLISPDKLQEIFAKGGEAFVACEGFPASCCIHIKDTKTSAYTLTNSIQRQAFYLSSKQNFDQSITKSHIQTLQKDPANAFTVGLSERLTRILDHIRKHGHTQAYGQANIDKEVFYNFFVPILSSEWLHQKAEYSELLLNALKVSLYFNIPQHTSHTIEYKKQVCKVLTKQIYRFDFLSQDRIEADIKAFIVIMSYAYHAKCGESFDETTIAHIYTCWRRIYYYWYSKKCFMTIYSLFKSTTNQTHYQYCELVTYLYSVIPAATITLARREIAAICEILKVHQSRPFNNLEYAHVSKETRNKKTYFRLQIFRTDKQKQLLIAAGLVPEYRRYEYCCDEPRWQNRRQRCYDFQLPVSALLETPLHDILETAASNYQRCVDKNPNRVILAYYSMYQDNIAHTNQSSIVDLIKNIPRIIGQIGKTMDEICPAADPLPSGYRPMLAEDPGLIAIQREIAEATDGKWTNAFSGGIGDLTDKELHELCYGSPPSEEVTLFEELVASSSPNP